MRIRFLFVLVLIFLSGIVYSFACAVPPDIIHEFQLDTSGPTVRIHYSLLGWSNLHPKMLDEITKNTWLDTVDTNLETIARDFLLAGSQLTINQRKINLTYITGSISQNVSSDPDYSYNPKSLIEIEFETDMPYPWVDSTEIRLIFDKTHLYNVSPLIHAYLYSDIQQNDQSQGYIVGNDNKGYFPASQSGHTYGFRNDLTETNTVNTFILYIEPMIDGKLSIEDINPASLSSSPQSSIQWVWKQKSWSVGWYLEPYIRGDGGLYLQIIWLVIAIFAGMLHGLLPGHAKSLIGTYMISTTTIRYRDILILIGSVTFSHTIFIFILATIIIVLEKWIGAMTAYVTTISAICYIGFGLYFYSRWTASLHHINHPSSLFTTKSLDPTDCDCEPIVKKSSLKWTTISGILAGANPCIDALALFIFAINIGSARYAFLTIVAFSLGLWLMLAILALVVTKSRVLLERHSQQFAARIIAHITILAGIAIVIMGWYTLLY